MTTVAVPMSQRTSAVRSTRPLPHRPLHPSLGRSLLVALVIALAASLLGLAPLSAEPAGEVHIEVLSNRADIISGGDALVEVIVPDGADADSLTVDVDGVDVTAAFGSRAGGRYIGLVDGLREGDNRLTATLPDGSGAHITITNHPISGPVFSGPHIEPWTCAAGATDEDCNRETTYSYHYVSSNPLRSGFQSYDPENPPSDVATTTTDEGNEVPFIVRQEIGVIARDEYRVAVLYDPAEPWEPWAPQAGYNGKLVITHGASCDTHYQQASAPGVLNEDVLGAGFAVMSHALNNAGHNCNIVTQAESMIMTKEHVVETYGELRYTIGTGCSGGALAQYQTANAYPGLYQGISPACSYPDAWSSAMQYVDYELLRDYFESGDGVAAGFTPLQWAAVYGHPNPTNPITFTEVIPSSGNPSRSCPGVPSEDVYHPEDNPDGVRCSLQDYMRNIFGTFPDTGFARRPWDNIGVQYGLQALSDGLILPSQFVDLNASIGSYDYDYRHVTERGDGDPFALDALYRSGANNTASNLDEVAIIDLRGPDPGAFHDVYRTYALRERLIREHGHADNQILWRGSVALFGDVTFSNEAIFALDRWLAAVEADDRDVPLAEKIVEGRPADVDHRCTSGAGQDAPAAYCDTVVEAYSTPRMEAGMPETDDVQKCALKPLDPADYPVDFTEEQWATLEATFPDGVCDYSQPDPHKTETVPWLTYANGPGGQPLGDPPASVPFGPDGPAQPDLVMRHAGANRIETAVAVSTLGRSQADTVVIARADDYADGLTGGPLATALDAPLLLSARDGLSPATAAAITRLGARDAILLGGVAALGEQVAADLESFGVTTRRIAGPNRYATAVAVATAMGGAEEVFLARGDGGTDGFADALSASGLAASEGRPILLTARDELPGETAHALEPDGAVIVVGGSAAVSESVFATVDERAGEVRRLAGATRYGTSAAVAGEALARGLAPAVVWVATGTDFPDALVAGAAAGRDRALLLLVDAVDLDRSPDTRDVVAANAPGISTVRIAGGTGVVSAEVEGQLRALLDGAR
jgi:putative cell wall-binding protein